MLISLLQEHKGAYLKTTTEVTGFGLSMVSFSGQHSNAKGPQSLVKNAVYNHVISGRKAAPQPYLTMNEIMFGILFG